MPQATTNVTKIYKTIFSLPELTLIINRVNIRAVVVPERSGTQRNAVPANSFKPERRSGKYCWSQAER